MDQDRSKRLSDFVGWARKHITGDEKSEAQIFLEHFIQGFGQPGLLDVGGKPEFRIKPREEDAGGTRFADYVWRPIVLIEMKKRGSDLARHAAQAFAYWTNLAPGRPRYVILCNFDEFWVYDSDDSTYEPADRVTLAELPDRYEPLAFLFPTKEKPRFKLNRVAATRATADLLARCFRKLKARRDVGRETAQRFTLQMLVCLFSEDIGLLPKHFLTDLLKECTDPSKTFDLLGGLLTAMNTPGGIKGGRYKGVAYFNGGLFQKPSPIELAGDELSLIKSAAAEDWSQVSPDIFGTIFQHSMEGGETDGLGQGGGERHAYGAHYTAPADIMKIVGPTIVEPWRHAIAQATSLDALRKLQERLTTYTVLDPACGSGNFLYIAYRELKRIEVELHDRIAGESPRGSKGQRAFGFVTSKQFFGMDILPFAVELAKVTMTLAHKLAIDELHVDEKALPLDNLDNNILCADALIQRGAAIEGGGSSATSRTPWPVADVIIGNPPFLGAKRLKPERGSDYVNAIRKLYPEVPGMADYCVYWFRRAHDHLPIATPDEPLRGRAGLVGTQNIRNNQSRVGGLDHIVQSGTIIEAVDNQPWSGEANVHVSIANWVKTADSASTRAQVSTSNLSAPPRISIALEHALGLPVKRKLWSKVAPTSPLFESDSKPARKSVTTRGKRGRSRADKSYDLAFRECEHINSALSDSVDVSQRKALSSNQSPKRCFQGKIPGYDGFLLGSAELKRLGGVSEIVVPYLTGRELLSDFRIQRWAIDFGSRSMDQAAQYKLPFKHVQDNVLPAVRQALADAERVNSDMVAARREHLQRWWQFWNRRDELSSSLSRMRRYIACSRVTRRPVMVFLDTAICPSDLIQVFAFEDDYSFGILQSELHFEWFKTSSRLKVETDLRYSVRSVFETFPWPQSPSASSVLAVALAARRVRTLRTELLQAGIGLRHLYRSLELPGFNRLREAHSDLDSAVRGAYGFHGRSTVLSQLLKLNDAVSRAESEDQPTTRPGLPPATVRTQDLMSEDRLCP